MIPAVKRKVLIITDWYAPGYKAGGPIQSCKNIVAALHNEYDFYILTSDRDLGETQPYQDIQTNVWMNVANNAQAMYTAPGYLKLPILKRIMKDLAPDVVYFNSMFSKNYTLIPLLALRQMRYSGKVILAPRGMLHRGAMVKKSTKKKLFLSFFQNSGVKKKVIFHATDEQEKADILHYFKKGTSVGVLENIPNVDADKVLRKKNSDELRMVFISRIHPKKNLAYILKLLADVETNGSIIFDVYGTLDDAKYLETCKAIAATLPPNIRVHFFDPLPHCEIFTTLHQYHLFVLPTLGENFGHAIFEALSSGCPVLISDQTPWRNLETLQAGWDIPLHNKKDYKAIIEQCISLDEKAYLKLSEGAATFAADFISNTSLKEKYTTLFS